MAFIVRSLSALVLVAGVAVFAWSSTLTTAGLRLAANTTALIMGGTFHSLMGPQDDPEFVTTYLDRAISGHLDPAFAATAGPVTNAIAVYGPEEFFPLGQRTLDESVAEGLANLNNCIATAQSCVYNRDPAVTPEVGSEAPAADDSLMVFGYSQSAVIASLAKRILIDGYQAGDPSMPFMLVANPMRPNGGLLMRGQGWPTIPILGVSFPGASPTDSYLLPDGTYAYPTVDVTRQYDGLGGDFPVRPLNILATINALLGYGLLHGETVNEPLREARFQGREGDTTYYFIETDIVPLLQPLAFFIPKPILAALDAPLRVIIEDAYERTVGPGTPTRASWWPVGDLFALAANLLKSIPVAVDNVFDGLHLGRPLGTSAPGTFGVGGPALPDEPSDTPAVAALSAPEPNTDRKSAETFVREDDPATDIAVDDTAPPVEEPQPAPDPDEDSQDNQDSQYKQDSLDPAPAGTSETEDVEDPSGDKPETPQTDASEDDDSDPSADTDAAA